MTDEGLGGVPRFLRVLTAFPEMQTVLTAMSEGVFTGAGVRAAAIWALDGEDLVLVGSVGLLDHEVRRYAVLPGGVDLTIWRSLRTGREITTAAEVEPCTAFAEADAAFWGTMMSRLSASAVVRTPVMALGTVVGALGLIVDRPWATTASASLRAITGPLGMWLTHPSSGCTDLVRATRDSAGDLVFSERQERIISLIHWGHTNAEIASTLGIAEPTVRADLVQVTRATGARNRRQAAELAVTLGLVPGPEKRTRADSPRPAHVPVGGSPDGDHG